MPASKIGVLGRRGFVFDAGPAAGAAGDREGVLRVRDGAFRRGPRGHVGVHFVGAAGDPGLQRRRRALEEFELEVFEGQLRVFAQRRGQLAGVRVGFELAGQLEDDAGFGVVDRDVDREQRVERVLVRGRQVDVARQRVVDQRRVDPHGADLGGVRAVGRRRGELRRAGGDVADRGDREWMADRGLRGDDDAGAALR